MAIRFSANTVNRERQLNEEARAKFRSDDYHCIHNTSEFLNFLKLRDYPSEICMFCFRKFHFYFTLKNWKGWEKKDRFLKKARCFIASKFTSSLIHHCIIFCAFLKTCFAKVLLLCNFNWEIFEGRISKSAGYNVLYILTFYTRFHVGLLILRRNL